MRVNRSDAEVARQDKAVGVKKKTATQKKPPSKVDFWVHSGAGSLVSSDSKGEFDRREAAFVRIVDRVVSERHNG